MKEIQGIYDILVKIYYDKTKLNKVENLYGIILEYKIYNYTLRNPNIVHILIKHIKSNTSMAISENTEMIDGNSKISDILFQLVAYNRKEKIQTIIENIK